MTRRLFPFLSAVIVLGLGAIACADEPELLPAPRPAPTLPVIYAQCRTDRYAVWSYYDVDRFGRFRPVVIDSPNGAYYLINGQPFPWTSTHPLEYKRVVVGAGR